MDCIKSKKIGILGGSFDPIHIGHLNIAKSACREFALDEVWFIPAGHSPNKNEREMTPAVDRAAMVALAIADEPQFRISDIELKMEQTSYTYLTLTRLKEQNPEAQLFFIMGADSLDYFEQWRHPEIICRMAVLLVAVRDHMNLQEIRKKISFLQMLFEAEIHPVSGGRTEISSTELRRQVKSGTVDSSMLPEGVATYIWKHRLYGVEYLAEGFRDGTE